MGNAFESWLGQEVVVQLDLGLVKVNLRGVLLRDLSDTLLMKPEAGPHVEIAKTKVLAIEEVERRPIALHGRSFHGTLPRPSQSRYSARVKNQNLRRHLV